MSIVDVFDSNTIIAASDAFSNVTDNVFLGRPWGGESSVRICIDATNSSD